MRECQRTADVPITCSSLRPREKGKLGLIFAAAGEDLAEDAVGRAVEFDLEFSGGAASLVYQRRIEEHRSAVDKRPGSTNACGCLRAFAARFFAGKPFVQRIVPPELLHIFFRPVERLAQRNKKFLAK